MMKFPRLNSVEAGAGSAGEMTIGGSFRDFSARPPPRVMQFWFCGSSGTQP